MRISIKLCLILMVLSSFLANVSTAFAAERTNPFKKIAESEAVAWLEEIAGSPQKAQELEDIRNHWKDLRTAAFVHLGALGTEASLAAAERIENKAKACTLTPAIVPIGRLIHPCWHVGDGQAYPLAMTEGPDGVTYAVIFSSLLGASDLCLISSRTPDDRASWSRPKIIPGIPCQWIRNPSLKLQENDLLVFSYIQDAPGTRNLMDGTTDNEKPAPALGPQKYKFRIQDVLRDQDGDGWTDSEEIRLGLDPKKNDTDGDGIADSIDCCPGFAAPDGHGADEEALILQKALFATFGLTESRCLLIANPKASKIQIWGYPGPVIYMDEKEWRKTRERGGIFVNWFAKRIGDEAEVTICDYEGPLSAGSQAVYLKKIKGRWTVTKREFGIVS